MSKTTPAPWAMKYTQDGSEFTGLIMGGEHGLNQVCNTGAAFWYNAKSRGLPVAESVIEEIKANSRLIEAAPELLAFAEIALERLDLNNGEGEEDEFIEQCRAAINKVKGITA